MEDRSTALQTFLRDLKAAREYQHVTLERIAGETHISREFLQALEDGEWERVPGPFLRGYLTAYAECVGMVRDKVLKRYDELDYQPPPARPREPEAPPPLPPSPFPPARRGAPEQAIVTAAANVEPAARRVPSFIQVIPSRIKALVVAAMLLLAALVVWGLTALVLGLLPGDASPGAMDGPTERPAGEERPVTLSGGTPFLVRVCLARPGQLRVMCQDTVCFSGVASPSETLAVRSATSVVVQAERLEDLRLWRDGRVLDLPGETGPADLQLTRQEVKVMPRKSP